MRVEFFRRQLETGLLQRSLLRGGTALCAGLASPLWAQAPGGIAVPSRPLWMEMAITVVMIGLALFAVCRTSNRT